MWIMKLVVIVIFLNSGSDGFVVLSPTQFLDDVSIWCFLLLSPDPLIVG